MFRINIEMGSFRIELEQAGEKKLNDEQMLEMFYRAREGEDPILLVTEMELTRAQ